MWIMRIRTAFAILSAISFTAIVNAQSALPPVLHVGDAAPELPIAGVIKGNGPSTLKGGVTVIEFWATWCGPCIASMPHLSDLADKYKGKVNFYSVNTWDFNGKKAGEKEDMDTHKTRVADWVSKNTEKMRYNIVQDTQDDKISTSWMFAAGKYGIPCAFIVNEQGKIAWVGHPMSMEKPLEEISNGIWDLNAFSATANAEIDSARAAREVQAKVSAAVKAGDKSAIDAIISSSKDKAGTAKTVISMSLRTNPDLAFSYTKQYFDQGEKGTMEWGSIFISLYAAIKGEADKLEVVKLSESNANAAKPGVAAIVYAYHARVLNSAGSKDSAMAWIEKAKAAVDTFEQAAQKDAVAKFIDSTAKSFNKDK